MYKRQDLYYRLNVLQIHLPPLRDRSEDIMPLAEHFLHKARERGGKRVTGIHPQATKLLLSHGWPGNVRELENSIERAVALCEGSQVMAHDLPPQLREKRREDIGSFALSRTMALDALEHACLLRVMKEEGGNKTRAAQRLGLDRKTLYRKLEEAGRAATEDGDGETDDGSADDHD